MLFVALLPSVGLLKKSREDLQDFYCLFFDEFCSIFPQTRFLSINRQSEPTTKYIKCPFTSIIYIHKPVPLFSGNDTLEDVHPTFALSVSPAESKKRF